MWVVCCRHYVSLLLKKNLYIYINLVFQSGFRFPEKLGRSQEISYTPHCRHPTMTTITPASSHPQQHSAVVFELSPKELMLLNCGAREDSWESLGFPRRSNQSILKENSLEYSLKGLMLKLKLQYSGHLMQGTDSLEKTLMLGKTMKAGGEGDDRGWDGWMASPTQWTWIWASSRSWWRTGKPDLLQSMGLPRVGHDWATGLNWFERWDRPLLVSWLHLKRGFPFPSSVSVSHQYLLAGWDTC